MNYAVVIDEERGYQTLIAQRSFSPGEVITSFSIAEAYRQANTHSLQVDRCSHAMIHPVELQYTNHSCAPNAFFDTVQGEVICLNAIQQRTSITIFYPATEWDMTNGFTCLCGSDNCLGRIQGAKYLREDILSRYDLSEHIKALKNMG